MKNYVIERPANRVHQICADETAATVLASQLNSRKIKPFSQTYFGAYDRQEMENLLTTGFLDGDTNPKK